MSDPTPLSTDATPRWLRTLLDNGLIVLLVLIGIGLGRFVDDARYVDTYHARVILKICVATILAVSLQLINGVSGQFSLGHAGFMAVGAYLGGYGTKAYSPEFQTPAAAVGFYAALFTCAVVAAGALFGVFALIRSSRRLHGALPGVLLIAAIAWFIVDISNAFQMKVVPAHLVWSKAIAGLGDLFSWLTEATQRVAPSIDSRVPTTFIAPLSLLVAILGGGLFAGLVGFVVGLPTLRLRGDYLAIATLGFAAIINVVIFNTEALGGAIGMDVPTYLMTEEREEPQPDGTTETVDVPVRFIAPWVIAGAIVTTAVVWRLTRSPKGRAIVAVREDEIAAAATGVDVTHHKVLAFVVGAFFAGVAGSLFAHRDGFVNTGTFSFEKSVELVVIVTIGGLGSIVGTLVATVVLTWLPEFLRDPASWLSLAVRLVAKPFNVTPPDQLHLPPWLVKAFAVTGEYRLVIYALLLILVMIARSNRGTRSWWPRTRERRPAPPANPPVAVG